MRNHEILQHSYTGIYLERSGVNAANMVEYLLDDPEITLSDSEKDEAYAYEAAICQHEVSENVTLRSAIAAQKDEETIAPLFFANAFLQGSVTLPGREQVGTMPTFESAESVYVWLAESIKAGSLSHESLVDMAKASAKFYANSVTEALVGETPIDPVVTECMPLVLQPEKFISMVNNIHKSRQYILEERQTYAKSDQPIDGAKRALTDVYIGKINNLVASDVPMSEYLYQQSALIGDEETMDVARESIPSGLRDAMENDRARPGVLKRLDYIRNGIGYNPDGRASVVSGRITAGESDLFESQIDNSIRHFTPEQIQVMKETMLTPEQQKQFFTNIIRAAGLLKEGGENDGKQNDEQFDVVINKSKATFMVSPASNEFKVASVDRSLYDTIVVGGFHELTHINQALADKQLGRTLKIAGMRGKRIAMLREGGANQKQRQAELKLFGRSKPVASLTYASALQSIEAGGGMKEAITAFYDAKQVSSPSSSKADAAAEAADRVLRIVRQGGINSKAMSYAEEAILHTETANLDDVTKVRATAITCLDLPDQVRLHRFGLLPSIDNTDIDWTQYVLDEAAPYIDEIVSRVK